jgi:hypothetical protein
VHRRLIVVKGQVEDEGLPPGVKRGGPTGYYREKEVSTPGGGTRIQERPVALTFEEAKAKRVDYYHPELGWVIEAYKLEKDREPANIMADGSSAVPDPDLFPTKA